VAIDTERSLLATASTPHVNGPLPGAKAQDLLALRAQYIPRGASLTVPTIAARAAGAMVEDVDGNTFIDFAGGIGVLNVGSTHPRVTAAVQAQAERFLHTCSHVVQYAPYIELARRLTEIVPGDFAKKTLLLNSGAEAVENAVKIARKFTGRTAIVTFENAFHGRTLLGMSLTSKVNPYKLGFGPFAPEIYRVASPYCYRCPLGLHAPDCGLACMGLVERAIKVDIGTDQVAAVIVEPVQGEGGFIPLPEGYLAALHEMCQRHGIVLIADEIQTGFGRTGKMLAVEHHGVAPDMVLLAKSLAAGLPLSAVVGRAEIMDSVHVGGLGGTYGGNPVACAAALAVLDIMHDEQLPARGAKIGALIAARLRRLAGQLPGIGDVRGLGAMLAIELIKPGQGPGGKQPAADEASRVIKYCYEHGLLILKAGILDNCVRALPPLVITDRQLETALDIWEAALRNVLA